MRRAIILTLSLLSWLLAVTSGTAETAAENDRSVARFPGTVVPAREAEITPIVSGWLNKINFVPGQFVEEGDALFEFGKRPQQLRIELAEAQLSSAEASLRQAEAQLLRSSSLEKKDVVSPANLQEAEATRDIAAANVEQARLTIDLQKLALSQLTQKAPFSGVMSAPMVRENGWQNVGGTGRDSIAMAVITQLDPIQVVGEVPYSVYAERRKLLKTDEATMNGIVLSLVLPDGEEYPHEGRLVSGGYKFDEDTQKLTVWGEFPNPDYLLRPGLRVTVVSTVRKNLSGNGEDIAE